jgi:hypothetical protein
MVLKGMTMWAPLNSPAHLEHYKDDFGGDYSPMRRVLARLAAKEYASSVYADTSMDIFCITLSPAYAQPVGTGVITLTYDHHGRFEVRYVQYGPSNRADATKFFCVEAELDRLLSALILRLHLTQNELGPTRDLHITLG